MLPAVYVYVLFQVQIEWWEQETKKLSENIGMIDR
jgi:hypothetical protein